MEKYCGVIDTLVLARKKHPGQKNNLDALCKRYFIDNSSRTLHGALLDSEILAEVYLTMTGGQTALSLSSGEEAAGEQEAGSSIRRLGTDKPELRVIAASDTELENHQRKLEQIQKKSGSCLWLN